MTADLPFCMVFEGRHSRAFCYNPSASKLWVRFNARLDEATGFAPPTPQNVALNGGFASMWVQAAVNDYYLNDDLLDLRRALHVFCARFDYVGMMGFSMGGFGALLLSRALRAQQAILVSPQRLGFPKDYPFRSSPQVEQALFQQGGDPELDGVSADLGGMVLFDPRCGRGRDRQYARYLAEIVPNLRQLPLVGAGHPATSLLHEAGKFAKFQRSVVCDAPDSDAVRELHRSARRKSPRYRKMLDAYLKLRQARVKGRT